MPSEISLTVQPTLKTRQCLLISPETDKPTLITPTSSWPPLRWVREGRVEREGWVSVEERRGGL